MAKEVKNKCVSFNLADDWQKKAWEYCCQKTNFSAYVKRLIQSDMEKLEKSQLVEVVEEDINSFF